MGSRKPEFEDKQWQFELAFAELNRRMEFQSRRLSSAESRAGVLIASASIVTGLLAGRPTGLFMLSMVLCVLAVGFGIAALFPIAIEEIKAEYTRDEILVRNDFDASLYLTRQYVSFIQKQEKRLSYRLAMVRVGLVLLGSSLVVAFAAVSML